MQDLCDVAYTLLADQVIADLRVEQQTAVMARLLGSGDAPIATISERLAELDAALVAQPKHVDPEQAELRRVLGIR